MEKVKELFERRMNLMEEMGQLNMKKKETETELVRKLVEGGHWRFMSINWKALAKTFWR